MLKPQIPRTLVRGGSFFVVPVKLDREQPVLKAIVNFSCSCHRILVLELRNQPYNFEMAEDLIVGAGIEIIVDKSIKPNYTKQK